MSGRAALALLLLATALSRWAVRTEMLHDWDAVQVAAGIEDYDVSRERPHGPGNPLFVWSAKALWVAGLSPVDAIVALNILCTLGALAIVWHLTEEVGLGRMRWLVVLALATNPLHWYNGAVTSAHPCEILMSSLVAWAAWRGRGAMTARHGLLLGVLLGVAAGFRPQLGGLLLPLVFWALWRAPRGAWLAGLAGLVCAVTAWAVPMVAQSGGLAAYLEVGGENLRRDIAERSILAGNVGPALRNAASGLVWLVAGLGALVTALPFARLDAKEPLRPGVVAFTLAWAAPFLAFHFFSHITRGGFWLPILPPLVLLIAAGLRRVTPRGIGSLTLLIVGLNAEFFLMVHGERAPVVPSAEVADRPLGERVAFAAGKIAGRLRQFTRDQIATEDELRHAAIRAIESFPASETLVVVEFELAFTWRQAAWYLAPYHVWGVHPEGWNTHLPGVYERTLDRESVRRVPAGIARVAWIGLHAPRAEDGATLGSEIALPFGRKLRVYALDHGALTLGSHRVEAQHAALLHWAPQ